jgi:hypothetical protein
MHRALEILGIGPDADERTIKRAYAAKLRVTRPEEDPQGFQALNEAYRAALAWRSARDAEAFDGSAEPDVDVEDPADNTVVEADNATGEHFTSETTPETTPDAASPPPLETTPSAPAASSDDATESKNEGESFDVERFFDDCFAAAHDGDPRVIDRWLNAQPILWSLQHKATIGHWLLRAMHEHTPPMPERNFDRIAEFFGYHELHGGYDPLALQGLRARVNDAWRAARQAAAYAPATAQPPGRDSPQRPTQADIEQERRETAYMHRLLHQHRHLVEPPSLLRNLRLGLNLKHPAAVRALLLDNPHGDLDALPQRIRRDQIAFWLAVDDDRRWTRPRVLIALTRCLALALPVFPLMLVLLMQEAPETGLTATIAFKAVLYPFAILASGWLTVATLKGFLYWQAGPDPAGGWLRRAHAMAVPLLATGSIASLLLEGRPPWSFPIGVIAAWTAFARWSRRKRGADGAWRAHPFIVTMALSIVALPFVVQNKPPSIVSLALAALLLWGHDLIRQRRGR